MSSCTFFFFFFKSYSVPRDLHSFPTRRSSDLPPLVIQYRSTSSWTSLGSVSASSTSYGNFPSSGANSKSWLWRSEEHTSELQSHSDLVCRLLLEKKNVPRPPLCAELSTMGASR